MVTRRTVIKHGGYAALAMAGGRLFVRDALAQATTTFDYYISPTGDDNNAGTLASPWSITALNNNAATYAGKHVGLLPGTYQYGTKGGVQTTLYSLCMGNQGGSQAGVAVNVNGGTAASPTLVASCNSSGVYSPRTATLNAANPSGGAKPSNFCGIIGQSENVNGVNFGNAILDGLIVTGSNGAGVNFFPASSSSPGGATGLVLRNSEIYGVVGNENGNMGGFFAYNCTGALITNNKIHDILPTSGNLTQQDCAGIFTQECLNNVYTYNTIYKCNASIYDKNTSQGATIAYNYLDNSLNPNGGIFDTGGGASGSTVTVYNNILVGSAGIWGVNAVQFPSLQNWIIYNNSIWSPSGGFNAGAGAFMPTTGKVTFYNNIVAAAGSSSNPSYWTCSGTVTLSDYNCLQDGGNLVGTSPASAPYSYTPYSLAAWRTASGFDAHSIQEPVGTMFTGYQSLNPASFQTVPAAVQALGRVGGVSTGAVTPAGAWGNGAVQIGCNFGPVPNAAVLTVS